MSVNPASYVARIRVCCGGMSAGECACERLCVRVCIMYVGLHVFQPLRQIVVCEILVYVHFMQYEYVRMVCVCAKC